MKKKKTFTGMALLLAILILGVGYASVAGLDLNITGTANVKANADFSVVFDQEHTVNVSPAAEIDWIDDENNTIDTPVVTGSYTDEVNAKMTVYLDSTHREATAIYKIINESDELKATLETEVSQNFETGIPADHLSVDKSLYSDADCTQVLDADAELEPGDVAYLKVTVSLIKLPVEDIESASFGVKVIPTPVSVTVE